MKFTGFNIQEMLLQCFSPTGFLSVGTYPLRLVNEGRLFYHSEVTALNNASRILHIKTGHKTCCMMTILSSGLEASVSLIENPIVTGDGTAIELMNYNREEKDDNLITKLYHTPTVTGGTGKQIKVNQSGFGINPGQAQSGSIGDARGYKLKKDSSYVYTITVTGDSKVIIGIELFE